MNSMRMARWAFAIALVVGASISPARAQQKVPGAELQEVLIKASLLSFNDANVTGNYAVFHAKLSKPFRDQFSPEKLAEIFKEFRDKRIDFDIIAAKKPIGTEEPKIADNGILSIKGYFETTPSRVNYDLAFIMSDGEWKLIKVNVDVKKPDRRSRRRDERTDRLVARRCRNDLRIEQALPEQIAVEQDGALLRVRARPAERAEQLADMAQPLAIDAAHGFRGGLVGARKRADRQLDREAADIGVAGVEVGEVAQHRGRRAAHGRLLADRRDAALAPRRRASRRAGRAGRRSASRSCPW